MKLVRTIALAATLSLGPLRPPSPLWAQKANSNDTVAKEEAPKQEEGSPTFAYVVCGLITFGILSTICRGSRRTVIADS